MRQALVAGCDKRSMQIDAIQSSDKGVVHQGHVRCNVDDRIIKLEGRISPRREGARAAGGGVLERGAHALVLSRRI